MKKVITHGELVEGMLNWRFGVLFRVTELTKFPVQTAYGIREVVRFTGIHVGGDEKIRHTIHDGGRYGAFIDEPATIELPEGATGEENENESNEHRKRANHQ